MNFHWNSEFQKRSADTKFILLEKNKTSWSNNKDVNAIMQKNNIYFQDIVIQIKI